MMTSANRMMIVEIPQTIIKLWYIICDLFFKGKSPLKIAKCSVYQKHCYFVSTELRANVSFKQQSQGSPSLLRTLPVTLLCQTAAYKCAQSFGKSCLQSLCV